MRKGLLFCVYTFYYHFTTITEILENVAKPQGINKATKISIDRLLKLKVTIAKVILNSLADELEQGNKDIKVPSERQIYNYTASLRRKDGSHLNYDELSKWCADHYTLPDDKKSSIRSELPS